MDLAHASLLAVLVHSLLLFRGLAPLAAWAVSAVYPRSTETGQMLIDDD
jgi:hypothetical protein